MKRVNWRDVFNWDMSPKQIVEVVESWYPYYTGRRLHFHESVRNWLMYQYDDLNAENPSNYPMDKYTRNDFTRWAKDIVEEVKL